MELSLCLVAPYSTGENFKFPSPKLVGYYSRNQECGYVNNISQLSYLTANINDVPFNLFGCNVNESGTQDQLLPLHSEYYANNRNKIREFSRPKLADVGIISNSNLFMDIFTIMFDWKPVDIYASLFQGNIYLDSKKPSFYGNGYENISRKFTQCMSSDDPNVFPDRNKTIDKDEEFFGIYETNINEHRVMCGTVTGSIFATKGGINATKIPADLNESDTIAELRQRTFVRLEAAPHSIFIFRKLWVESLLTNVNDFYIGYYECQQTIQSIRHQHADEIYNKNAGWSLEEYLGFCDTLFSFIKLHFELEIKKRKLIINDEDIRTIPKIQLTFTSNKVISINLKYPAKDDHLPESYTSQFF